MSTSDSCSDNETPFGSTVSSYLDLREIDGAFKDDFKSVGMFLKYYFLNYSIYFKKSLFIANIIFLERKVSKASFNGQDWVKCKFLLRTTQEHNCPLLLGDFTSWDKHPIPMTTCQEGFEATVMLLKGVYEYKFRADERWMSDSDNPYKSTQYGNSLLFVSIDPNNWKCDHWKVPNLEYIRPNCNFWYFLQVETEVNTELGKAGMRKRPVYVFLPPGYESSADPLPVVYAIDGYNLFSTGTQGRFLDKFLDSKWSNGSLPEFILVAIPSMDVAFPGFGKKDLFVNIFSELGNETYLKFLLQIVVPTIKSKFRVSSDPKQSVIMGDHYGGLISFAASLIHPDTFGKSISLSPSFGYHDRENSSIFDFMRKEKPSLRSSFYLDSSNLAGDNKYMTQAMAAYLSDSKAPIDQYKYENLQFEPLKSKARLSNLDWQLRVEKALQFVLN